VVGCPKLDTLPKRSGTGGPVVAVSFHFDLSLLAETRSARMHFTSALPGLARSYRLIGHSHPRLDLSQFYRRMGIEYVRDFDEVCRRADVYVCDNSSTLFEFAATGRPVVVLNEPHYRRDVEHGLRFWDAADVGIQVDSPHDLAPAIRLALDDGPEQRARREAALSLVYAYRTGGAKRAAEAIMGWAAEVAA
jgi:UDP-N-acetylglucosamine:LPS N-acetylglucosamine transferase